MTKKKIYPIFLILVLYPTSVALANPTVGPPSPASAFILPIIAEVGVILYSLRDLSFKKIRLGGSLLAIHSITYPVFFFATASLKGTPSYDISIILGEIMVVIFEGGFLFVIAKSQWLQFTQGLSLRRAMFASVLGNICSFLVPYIALFFPPLILLIKILSLDSRFLLPISFLLIYLYLRRKPFIRSIPSNRKVFLDISMFVVIVISYVIAIPYFLSHPTNYSRLSRNAPHSQFANKSCLVSNEQAISKTEDFMNKIGLIFKGSQTVTDISRGNDDYPGTRNLKEITIKYPDGRKKFRFYVGCESGEVENFDDIENWEDNFREGNPLLAKIVPSDCKTAIESLSKQIGIPSDMYFEKVEKDWRKGLWVGKFIRMKDGYKYDLDFVDIGISDKTRRIALYKRIYFGQACPTEIKIKKDEAINIASTEFLKFIFGRIRSHSEELYERDVQLLIVQPERPKWAVGVGQIVNPPLKEKPSRLAWVIRYSFTGGMKFPKSLKPIEEMNPKERQDLDAQMGKRDDLLNYYGYPVVAFEMRIDASNGDILYVSHKDPLYYYYRWLLPGHWE